MNRKRNVKIGSWIRNICLLIVSVILLTSLLSGDDTNAYGEGRRVIFKNPINPDYESNDNGVKTTFKIKALNTISGEVEFSSNAMSLISVSEEDKKRSTVKNYADILDLDICSNLAFMGEVENTSDVARDISFEIKLPVYREGDLSKINLIPSDLDVFSGDLTDIKVIYYIKDETVTEDEKKSGKEFDFEKLEKIKVEGSIKPSQKFNCILPMDVAIVEPPEDKYKTPEEIVDELKRIDDVSTDNVFDFDIDYRYPITKKLNLSIATCHTSERKDDFSRGKIVGIVKKEDNNYAILPSEITENFPAADRAKFSMFFEENTKEDFVNSYSEVKLDVSDLQELVKDAGYSLILNSNELPQEFKFKVGDKIHIYDEDGLELTLGKKDKHGIPLSKVYVEFQRVLECKDSEIAYKSKWDKFDNLAAVKIGDKEIDKEKIKVEGNVNTDKKGEYIVKYSYEIYSGMWISNTAKINVVDEMPTEESSEDITDSNVRLDFK